MIELTDVKKMYLMGEVEVWALRRADLIVEEGELMAVQGPSGSGKSTLLNILGCLDTPTTGTYRLAGTDVGRLDDDELALFRSEHIGFIFQGHQLLPRLSAMENVQVPLIYQGIPPGERRQMALKVLEDVGLSGRASHRPAELSGGESQRVAIARALVTNPKLLLADEPTGNLDQTTGADIMEIIKKLNVDRGLTAIVVTHDSEVAMHCGRKIIIRDGRIEAGSGLRAPG